MEIHDLDCSCTAAQSEKSRINITLLDIAAFVWLLGSLLFMAVHLMSYFHYKRQMVKSGAMISDTRILRQLSELKRGLHIKRTIQMIEYSKADSPMMIGFLKPVLVLPEAQYRLEELFFILKHELVHLKRGDVYFKLLFTAANAVHWFNPLVWIMRKEAAVDMELSCDEQVTQGADYAVRKAYTETLLSMLHKQCAKRTVLSTQFYGGKKIMKKRFQNILTNNRKKSGIFVLLGAVILTIGLGTLAGGAIVKEGAGGDLPFEQMAGRWVVDFNVTDQLWGSGISYGNRMEISEAGEFSYYIGIGVGGTGWCEEKNGVVTVEIQPYEEHSSKKEILTLEYVNDNGAEHILMDCYGEEVCWKRDSSLPADGNAQVQ